MLCGTKAFLVQQQAKTLFQIQEVLSCMTKKDKAGSSVGSAKSQ